MTHWHLGAFPPPNISNDLSTHYLIRQETGQSRALRCNTSPYPHGLQKDYPYPLVISIGGTSRKPNHALDSLNIFLLRADSPSFRISSSPKRILMTVDFGREGKNNLKLCFPTILMRAPGAPNRGVGPTKPVPKYQPRSV